MDSGRRRLLVDGLAAGFIGYLVVVLFFVLWNLVEGRSPFYTAALLGEAIFGDLREPAAVVVDPGMVLAFNGLHLLAFLGFGFFGAWLVHEAELHPEFWYLSLVLFVVAVVGAFGAVAALTTLAGNLLSPFAVVGASLTGALGVAAWLTTAHRPLIRSIPPSGEAGPEA